MRSRDHGVVLAMLLGMALLLMQLPMRTALGGGFSGSSFSSDRGSAFGTAITSGVASGAEAVTLTTGQRIQGGVGYWYMDAVGGGRWISSVPLYVIGGITAGGGDLTAVGRIIGGAGTLTVPDDGAGTSPAGTLTPSGTLMYVACNDANGCTITLSETGALAGQWVTVVSTGTGTANFADTAGVSETAGAFAAGGSAGGYDSISYQYITDRWVEQCRSNN